METTMTLEKYKSMKKAKNVREEKKLKKRIAGSKLMPIFVTRKNVRFF